MFYQWFKEGEHLKAETSNELALTKVKPINEGLYICRVANVRGFQFSRWIRVVVEKQGQAVEIVEEPKRVGMVETKIPAAPVVSDTPLEGKDLMD